MSWLKRSLSRTEPVPAASEERLLALEKELQSLRLELAEREKTLTAANDELERLRASENARVQELVRTRFDRFMQELAAPSAHLLTQAHLLRQPGTQLGAQDVMLVAERLVRTLADYGLKPEAAAGQTVPFDPQRHEPLEAGQSINALEPVMIRFCGIAFEGRLLRKARVELARTSQ